MSRDLGSRGRWQGGFIVQSWWRVEPLNSLVGKTVSQSGEAGREPPGTGTRRLKRLCEEWLGSPTMLVALQVRRVPQMSRREGRGTQMIRPEAFIVCCRVLWLDAVQLSYHTVMQPVRMLSMVPL